MQFVDEAKVVVLGGDGGSGIVSWLREKFRPLGGPDGGDGGNGGAVIFVATSNLNTLLPFAFASQLKAQDGEPGGGNGLHGRDGEDLIRTVPVGTQIFFQDNLVADLNVDGARWVAARGGRGGKGNAFFKSSTNQAPDYAQKGQVGETFELRLVLKSIADIGLVGLPNVGKSTLIGAISNSRATVANYSFTTLSPNLGVVILADSKRYVVADMPGIIEGAHLGRGLGIKFLKHIERTVAIAYVIDISQGKIDFEEDLEDEELLNLVKEQFATLESELKNFQQDLITRAKIIVFSKADMPFNTRAFEVSKEFFSNLGLKSLLVSCVENRGLEEIKSSFYDLLPR